VGLTDGLTEAFLFASRRLHATSHDVPKAAAQAIIRGIRRNRTRILVGADARMLAAAARIAPRTTQRLITWGWRRLDTDRFGAAT
jgi:hypothetical protein